MTAPPSDAARQRSEARWVCLMYHDVTAEPRWQASGREYFSVAGDAFARQLDIIVRLGLRGRSIEETAADPAGAVAISFDDGDLGQAMRAFPALAARAMTATFFVVTDWVGKPSYASWEQLREMKAAGMSIQSHTHSHPFLSQLGPVELRDELRRSRDILDERLDQRTHSIALPGGDWPRVELRPVLVEEGYAVVATSRWGRNAGDSRQAPSHIRRCTVRAAPDDSTFAAIVTANRWLNFRRQARERALSWARASLGPKRYARWRQQYLGARG